MKYNPPLGGAANDPFIDGNEGTGTEGSDIPAAALEFPQRELAAVIAAATGLVPTNADLTQLLQALKQLFGGNLTNVTANEALVASQAGLIVVDATAGNIAITLPAANAQAMLPFEFLRIDTVPAHTVTIAAAGADHIDQGTSFTLAGQNAGRSIKADGTSVWRSSATAIAVPPACGAQLQFTDATHLTLAPVEGGLQWINGLNYSVPANLQITNAGLAASTSYFVYVWMNAGAMALEISATGYTIASNGTPQKTGDVTRTLVGAIDMDGATHFQPQGVGTASYFHRRLIALNASAASVVFTNNPPTLLKLTTALDIICRVWADDGVWAVCDGVHQSDTVNGGDDLQLAVDGALLGSLSGGINAAPANSNLPFSSSYAGFLAEGKHTISLYGNVTPGQTGTVTQGYTRAMVRA